MKIVFMGTPEFSVTILEALLKSNHEITAVFSRADKPAGRGKKLQPPPVKLCAQRHGITLFQPISLRLEPGRTEVLAKLKELNPDAIVVAAYGQILPAEILTLPKHGCVNVHASLLPLYRGASPISAAIADGLTETGVTIMRMDEGIDTGDMILQEKTEITDNDNLASVTDKLAVCGANALISALARLESGSAKFTRQIGESCYSPVIKKDDRLIDFSKGAKQVRDMIRSISPEPCAYCVSDLGRLKVYAAEFTEAQDTPLDVTCGGGGVIRLTDIQLEGGKRMSGGDFLRGRRIILETTGQR